jgi:cell division protein FtsI (penicillin-binding protein 3)
VNGLRIHDHKAYKDLTVAQILEHSSDVGAIKLALRLGEERFDRYIRAFGFGSQTGIELPDETRGITRPVQRWSKVSIGAISMGQEIGVTPLQLVSMISSIANDGMYVAPRIVAGTTPPRSTPQLIAFHPVPGRRVISPMTAAQMKHMMEGVVLRGTGTRAALDGYSVAGKTGTSQKVDAVTHRYSHQLHVASFAGFSPVNNPAITVLVVMDAPQGPQDGGLVAAPIFSRVAQQVLAYMNVPHDIDVRDSRHVQLRAKAKDEDLKEASPDYIAGQPENVTGPQPAGEPANSEAQTAIATPAVQQAPAPTDLSAVAAPISRAEVITARAKPAPLPPALTPIPASTRGTVVLDVVGGVLVPDFHGKTLRSALEVAESAGLELEVSGSGVGTDQSPPAGARIPPGGHVTVHFAR